MRKGIEFQSTRGNRYFYDDRTGMILLLRDQAEQDTVSEKYLNLVEKVEPCEPTPELIREQLIDKGAGFRQLILEVTSQCNLRCKYCVYSEHYPFTHSYENSFMDWETARRAVDLYMDNFAKVRRRNPSAYPTINFYGGEPLINFDLIRKVVEYYQQTYEKDFDNQVFAMTTNGLLLKEDIAGYFVDHHFSIVVSLDGDREAHNRNRVKPDGSGSFDEVYGNLVEFRRRYPDYDRLGISVCFDYRSDFFTLAEFFDAEDLFVINVSQVSPFNSSYYRQFTPVELQSFLDNREAFGQMYLDLVRRDCLPQRSFLYSYIGVSQALLAFHPMVREHRTAFCPFTSTCVPGEKLYVTADGKIHMCERINSHFPIGDLDRGLDYPRITELLRMYNQTICTKCEDCPVSRFCDICFANIGEDGTIPAPDDRCRAILESIRESLVDYVDLSEDKPEALDNVTVDYYNSLRKKVGYFLD